MTLAPGRECRPIMPHLTEDFVSEFLSRMTPTKSDAGCVTMDGRPLAKYRSISVAGATIGAHRISWTIANGRELGSRMQVCHECDNPGCVNPDHLWEGTDQENMRDASRKGRMVKRRGKRVVRPATMTRSKAVSL